MAQKCCNGDSWDFAIMQVYNALTVISFRLAVGHGGSYSSLLRLAFLPPAASSLDVLIPLEYQSRCL